MEFMEVPAFQLKEVHVPVPSGKAIVMTRRLFGSRRSAEALSQNNSSLEVVLQRKEFNGSRKTQLHLNL